MLERDIILLNSQNCELHLLRSSLEQFCSILDPHKCRTYWSSWRLCPPLSRLYGHGCCSKGEKRVNLRHGQAIVLVLCSTFAGTMIVHQHTMMSSHSVMFFVKRDICHRQKYNVVLLARWGAFSVNENFSDSSWRLALVVGTNTHYWFLIHSDPSMDGFLQWGRVLDSSSPIFFIKLILTMKK